MSYALSHRPATTAPFIASVQSGLVSFLHGLLNQPTQEREFYMPTLKVFKFNVMRIKHPNITKVMEISAPTMAAAKLEIPEGWKIITSKESKLN